MGNEIYYSGELRLEPPVPASAIDTESLNLLTALDGKIYTLAFAEHASGERALAALICGEDDYGWAKEHHWEDRLYALVAIAQAAGSTVTGQMTYRDDIGGHGVTEIDSSGNLDIRMTQDLSPGRLTTPSVEDPGAARWALRSLDGSLIDCDSEATAADLHSRHPHLALVTRTADGPWHTSKRGVTAIPGPAADAMASLWSSRELADQIAPLLRCDEVAALAALLGSLNELGGAARWSASHADAHGNCPAQPPA